MTEPLSYSFFLFALSFLVAFVFDGRTRDWLLYLGFAGLAILTRPQFLFLHVVSVAVLLALALRDRSRRKILLIR